MSGLAPHTGHDVVLGSGVAMAALPTLSCCVAVFAAPCAPAVGLAPAVREGDPDHFVAADFAVACVLRALFEYGRMPAFRQVPVECAWHGGVTPDHEAAVTAAVHSRPPPKISETSRQWL